MSIDMEATYGRPKVVRLIHDTVAMSALGASLPMAGAQLPEPSCHRKPNLLARGKERFAGVRGVRRALRRLSIAALTVFALRDASAMDVNVTSDQLILSGPVIDGDLAKIEDALKRAPAVTTVILRNSPGGDIATGYRGGELFRQKGLQTAVSGYCYSSCSRLFLGGKTRVFTDDLPPENTHVGFHGHYDRNGQLNSEQVERFGLAAWIIQYSDGKADPALVRRWVTISDSRGLIHFFHPSVVPPNGRSGSTFFCDRSPRASVFDCEPIARTALDLGIITSLDRIGSHDMTAIRAAMPSRPAPSGYAAIGDQDKLPLGSAAGKLEYQRFLGAASPRAFAIAPDHSQWAWTAGNADVATMALMRCAERSGQTCSLYALDDDVVWTGR